jgi:hypothetical protein
MNIRSPQGRSPVGRQPVSTVSVAASRFATQQARPAVASASRPSMMTAGTPVRSGGPLGERTSEVVGRELAIVGRNRRQR